MSMTPMPIMALHNNSYKKGEKLHAARTFDMSYGSTSVTIPEGSVAKVVSETGQPLVVKFEAMPPVSIPMSDAEKFLRRAPMGEEVESNRMKRSLLLAEGVIAETRHPVKVSESAGRTIRVTKIDQTFTMRPFSLIPMENLTSLVGKTGEIMFEFMEFDGRKVYKCNFQEAGRVALADSEFEYVEPGKSGSFDNKSESRRLLQQGLTEKHNLEETKLVRGDKLHPDVRKQVLGSYVHRWTHENSKQSYGGKCPGCAQGHPTDMSPEQWHKHHMPLVSDNEWLSKHAFHVTKSNKLSNRHKHAEPHYMADESVVDEKAKMCLKCHKPMSMCKCKKK